MRRYLDDSEATEAPPGDFGEYSIEYMMETGGNFIHYHIMPAPGGWDDQPYAWVEALKVWIGWYSHIKHKTKQNDGGDMFAPTGGDSFDWFDGG